MTTFNHEVAFCLLLSSELLYGVVVRASEHSTDETTSATADRVQIVNRVQEESKSLEVLWQQYKATTSLEYRRMTLMIMTSRPSREMTPEIDREVCNRFEKAPDPDLAMLLGMCTSDRSLHLLSTHEKALDQSLANAVRLALARRGDANMERAFIEEFLRQPVGKGGSVDWATDKASGDSIRDLEYIGSPQCVLALFDSAVSMLEKETNGNLGGTAPVLTMVANMREFLSQIDVSMPEKATKQEICNWWKQNRTKVSTRINQKDVELPRLKPTRIVISHD